MDRWQLSKLEHDLLLNLDNAFHCSIVKASLCGKLWAICLPLWFYKMGLISINGRTTHTEDTFLVFLMKFIVSCHKWREVNSMLTTYLCFHFQCISAGFCNSSIINFRATRKTMKGSWIFVRRYSNALWITSYSSCLKKWFTLVCTKIEYCLQNLVTVSFCLFFSSVWTWWVYW